MRIFISEAWKNLKFKGQKKGEDNFRLEDKNARGNIIQ